MGFKSCLLYAAALVLIWSGCSGKKSATEATAIIAVEGDIDSFNPLFAEEIVSGEINDLIFPRLVNSEFDTSAGELLYTPYLAQSWEFSPSGKEITFHLRTDASWSDGKRVTSRDVQYSFELYADTSVASVRQSAVQNFRLTDGHLIVSQAVETPNDSTVIIHFESASPTQLFDIGVPLLPAHEFEKISRSEIRHHPINKAPVTCGPFALSHWSPMQEIVLVAAENMGKHFTPHISKLIFKVLPDYGARLAQFQAGEVDIITGLRLEDAGLSARNPNLNVVSMSGRDYDFIGWNAFDPDLFARSEGKQLKSHRLFGSATVRRALTMAVNREEIVKAYLGNHGRLATGGISPLFKWAYNDTLTPVPFDKQGAELLLSREGWKDADNDGTVEKNGVKFSFTLKIPAGNQLRDVIATVIQQQLRDVKIEMKIEQVEHGTFWNEVMMRKYDAWFAGFSVPLQMQMDDLWASDLKRYPFNLAGLQNKRVDEILSSVKTLKKESDGGPLWKEFQSIVNNEQPYTFLFWINNIVGVNKRLQSTHIGVLGTTHKAWDWEISG